MKTSSILSIVTAAVGTLLLCQCATNRTPVLKPGEAYFNASPEKQHHARLTGLKVVSVNGKKTRGSATRVPSGPVTTVVSFHWPKIGKMKAPLSFHARDGHSYFVKYDRYPHPGSTNQASGRLTKGLLYTASGLMRLDVPGVILGLPIAGAAILTGFVEHAGKGVGLGLHSPQAAHYIDLFVISRLSSEGVVRKVRVHPSGKIEKQ